MNNYELTIVLPEKATEAKKKAVIEKLENLAKAAKAKIGKTEDWGKIDLCYKIKKNQTGLFLHFKLELERPEVKGFSDKLRLEGDIIRFLLIRV